MDFQKKLKKKSGWKNKGNTLIEVVAALTIYLILFLAITRGITEIALETDYIYKEQMRKNNIESGIKTLKQYLAKPDNLYFDIKENKFTIYKKGSGKTPLKDEIYLDEKNKTLYLKYYREENGSIKSYKSLILVNILDFEIIKKEKLVYFKIFFEGGEKIICI